METTRRLWQGGEAMPLVRLKIQILKMKEKGSIETMNMHEAETCLKTSYRDHEEAATMLESINAGGNGGPGSPQAVGENSGRAGGHEATPNPAEKTRQRFGLLPFGATKDVNMEGGATPVTLPFPGGGPISVALEPPMNQLVAS